MDAAGYIHITGRIKDMIIRGGENIHPLEIENCLLGHPRIAQVSVVGLPDERYGEVVAAFVIPVAQQQPDGRGGGKKKKKKKLLLPLSADDVREWVRGKLSHHLVPKHVFFRVDDDDYPKTASGKIQKFKLQEEGIRMLSREKEKGKKGRK
ncbi:MAG: hypothetical protein Q9197_004048 [Variospora fuerteventurae]